MKDQEKEFQKGKEFLANMMGEDVKSMKQDKIDVSFICYF